jgi:hypothetical protein
VQLSSSYTGQAISGGLPYQVGASY